MIGEPTLDPALGEKRRKALQAALARAAGFGGAVGAPRAGGVGRSSVSGFGFKPISRGGRPSSILNFLGIQNPGGYANGQASKFGAGTGLGALISDVQLPQPLPAPSTGAQSGTGGATGLSAGGTTFGVPTYGGDGSSTGTTQLPVNNTGQFVDNGGVDSNGVDVMSFSPSPAPGSGMIPLGGGVFLDPDTGMLHGSGGLFG